jgi:hypothetical protein
VEIDAFDAHHKAKHVSGGSAAKTVKHLARWVHVERGIRVRVKRANAFEIGTRSLECNVFPNDIGYFSPLSNLCDFRFGDQRTTSRAGLEDQKNNRYVNGNALRAARIGAG